MSSQINERHLNSTADFYQSAPQLGNQYTDDLILRELLDWLMPSEYLNGIEPDLTHLGERVVTDILELAADAQNHPPELVHYDPWGRRIDEIKTASGWKVLHAIAATEGIVATAYEQQQNDYSRLHQFVRLYLFHPSSAMICCPLAMADGAASVLKRFGNTDEMRQAFTRLVTRNPDEFWTSGQWMTERAGGSDVSQISTRAIKTEQGYVLYGNKWFTSATTSDMALVLAKIDESDDLSLFFLHTRDRQGKLNRIEIQRLKDKLGTRAMPTAELNLDGTSAQLIGEAGQGVKTVATMLNITRLYNAVCALAYMRRGLALALDYAARRQAFGKRLMDQPLHARTLEDLQFELEGAMHLVFYVGLLLGKQETKVATQSERLLLRLFTPICKLYTGKQVVAVTSEVLECFGGAGYIEDTGLPRLLRDAQVLPIWEGTTNVLSLDVLRVLRDPDIYQAYVDATKLHLESDIGVLTPSKDRLALKLENVSRYLQANIDNPYTLQKDARQLAFVLARIAIASLLYEHACWRQNDLNDTSARRLYRAVEYWSSKPLTV